MWATSHLCNLSTSPHLNPTFDGIDDLRTLNEYKPEPVMGSKTPDGHRRGPDGMKKEYPLVM